MTKEAPRSRRNQQKDMRNSAGPTRIILVDDRTAEIMIYGRMGNDFDFRTMLRESRSRQRRNNVVQFRRRAPRRQRRETGKAVPLLMAGLLSAAA